MTHPDLADILPGHHLGGQAAVGVQAQVGAEVSISQLSGEIPAGKDMKLGRRLIHRSSYGRSPTMYTSARTARLLPIPRHAPFGFRVRLMGRGEGRWAELPKAGGKGRDRVLRS